MYHRLIRQATCAACSRTVNIPAEIDQNLGVLCPAHKDEVSRIKSLLIKYEEELEQQRASLKNEIKFLQEERTRLIGEREDALYALEEQSNASANNRYLQANEAALAQLFGITAYSRNSLVGQVEEKKFRLQEQINALQTQLTARQTEATNLKVKINTLQAETQQLKQKLTNCDRWQSELATAKNEAERLKAKVKDLEATLAHLETTYQDQLKEKQVDSDQRLD
jgi:chromosome segregation ATPase